MTKNQNKTARMLSDNTKNVVYQNVAGNTSSDDHDPYVRGRYDVDMILMISEKNNAAGVIDYWSLGSVVDMLHKARKIT